MSMIFKLILSDKHDDRLIEQLPKDKRSISCNMLQQHQSIRPIKPNY